VVVKDKKIKERWKSYFEKLLNGSHRRNCSKLTNPIENGNFRFTIYSKN